jgi:hypothetical protein
MLQTLRDNKMYDDSHPFLNKDSPFYLNPTEAEVLPVELKQHLQESLMSE